MGAAAFAAAFGAIWFFGSGSVDSRPKCDSADVAETVKSLANDSLRSSPEHLLTGSKDYRAKQSVLQALAKPDYRNPPKLEFYLSAVRDRGQFGKHGTSCAAVVQLLLSGNVVDFSTTYIVEPANDGKTTVTARFQPNSG